jgi:putative redox protein
MSAESPPPVRVALDWRGERRFEGRAGDLAVVVDGERQAGLSPPQAVAVGLAGCMGIDVVDVLRKGRIAVRELRVELEGERAAEPPRRFTRMAVHFVVTADVAPDRVERAIALSRERYCSVWHSLRPDTELETSFEIRAPGRP